MHPQNDEADFDSRIVELKAYIKTAVTLIDVAVQASKRHSSILGIVEQRPWADQSIGCQFSCMRLMTLDAVSCYTSNANLHCNCMLMALAHARMRHQISLRKSMSDQYMGMRDSSMVVLANHHYWLCQIVPVPSPAHQHSWVHCRKSKDVLP